MAPNMSLSLLLPAMEPNTSLPLPLPTIEPCPLHCGADVAGEKAQSKLDRMMLKPSHQQAFASVQLQHMILPAPLQDPKRRYSFHESVTDTEEARLSVPAAVQSSTMNSQENARNTQGARPLRPATPQLPVMDFQEHNRHTKEVHSSLPSSSTLSVGDSPNSSVSGETVSTNTLHVDNLHSAPAARGKAPKDVVGQITKETMEIDEQTYTSKDVDKEFKEAQRYWWENHGRFMSKEQRSGTKSDGMERPAGE